MDILKFIFFMIPLIATAIALTNFVVGIFDVLIKYVCIKTNITENRAYIVATICLIIVVIFSSNTVNNFYNAKSIINSDTKIAATEIGQPFYVYNNGSITNRYLFTPLTITDKGWIYMCEDEPYKVSYSSKFVSILHSFFKVETFNVSPIDKASIKKFKITKSNLLYTHM